MRNLCAAYPIGDQATEIPTKSFLATNLLKVDESFFFNNLFAKLRYFGNSVTQTSNSSKHLLLVLKSLRTYAKDQL